MAEKTNYIESILKLYELKVKIAKEYIYPFLDLAIRYVLCDIFFKSAKLKMQSGFLGIGEGNWNSTLNLFKQEYKVLFLDPTFAAYMGTIGELVAAILIIIGFGTRLGAFMILVITGVIEYSYMSSNTHIYWALLAGVLLLTGPSKISADYWIKYFTFKKYNIS